MNDCCFEAFKSRYYEDHNIAEAVVTSVCPLSEEQQKRLKEKLKKISGKEIILIQKTDPALLAGVRVELDGKLLDGTVKNRISEISDKIHHATV